MDGIDLPSSSEESDVDFIPKGEEDNSDTGSEVSDCETSEGENNGFKSGKRKKISKKCNKKAKTEKTEEKKEADDSVEEKREINVDALWADFKKEVNSQKTKRTAQCSYPNTQIESGHSSNKPLESSSEVTALNTKTKPAFSLPNKNKAGGGLSKVLNQIKKVDKMTTLQKSQLDWNNFKKSEGIEEEIKTFNKGKDGYLEKQDFLQRTDLRQFEIEKDLRTARRKF